MKEHSAGAVVYTENPRRYLILHYQGGHWSFPKGKLEKRERPLETARRETKEETGIDIEFVPGFKQEVKYFFRRGKETVDKKVDFYLAKALSTQIELSFEHIGYRWLKADDAIKQLTFENDREILEKAEEYLN